MAVMALIHFQTFGLFVIWSLGISMIFLAAIIHLKLKHVLIFSLLVIFGHNALDSIQIGNQIFWSIIHERNFIDLSNGVKLLAAYPILPWIGVMSFGYYIGSFYENDFPPLKLPKFFHSPSKTPYPTPKRAPIAPPCMSLDLNSSAI